MEDSLSFRISVPEMYQKPHTLSFLGRRSFVPRPLSEATEIYETDFEDDAEDSPSSLDSASTFSDVQELQTPNTPPLTAGLGGYHFHIDDKTVEGPYGPHLFMSEQKHYEPELFIASSPIPSVPQTPTRDVTTLNTAVAELDEAQVRSWNPEQVADWMTTAGFDSLVVDKFLVHDINGTVLLDLQFEDLKELDISSFGKRHQVMSTIQNLRNSTMIASPVSRKSSQVSRSESRRRGRFHQPPVEDISPAESVSIVAIEQVLPKPHRCSKGEECPKWQRQQRKIQKLEAQFAADMKSIVVPSIAASSDIFGPTTGLNITSERLSSIEPRDPLESVRNFLSFQHVNSPLLDNFTDNLHGLPKLTIPTTGHEAESPYPTPLSAFRHPTEEQAKLTAELQQDPYHYGGVASPVDVYRLGTPMSTTDIPVTAMSIDPCQRETSHSVPPEMRFGASHMMTVDPVTRPHTTQPSNRRRGRPSFVPQMTALHEFSSEAQPPVASEAELANHSGWMRRRKTTRLMKHEWQDNYFTLTGAQLDVANDELSDAFQSINVDDYTLHAYTTASSSKLSAAFKKTVRSTSPEPTFAFSLIPEAQKNTKKFFDKEKSHHFAVNSGTDRVEWMRKLMLAKAMKKNDGQI